MDILNEIGKYSSKYKKALEEIILHPKENCFVYSQFYKGSGIVVFSELLKILGYKESKGNDDYLSQGNEQVLRFAILAEKITNKLENNIKIFNKPENKHGKYIQVLIGSPLVSEGRSFFNVRQIHILTPHWNMSLTEQVTGRGIRAFSHKDLDEKDRFVKVYRHCSMPNKNIQSIDYIMYEISEMKDLKIKQIERICKEIAIDCALNKKRNLLTSDVDNTRECDYQTCNYICDNVPDNYIQKRLEMVFSATFVGSNQNSKDKLIHLDTLSDTYNLYYGDKLVKSTINIIQQLFKRTFTLHIKDLMRHFGDISFILLIRSLKYIIQNNIPIINKYGFICFLKYERNLFFLTDNIQSPNSFFVNYYCKNPPVYKVTSFKSLILENQSNNIETLVNHINSLDINSKNDFKEASNLLLELKPEIQEQIIEFSIFSKVTQPSKIQTIREICLKIFISDIIEFDDMFVSLHLIEESKFRYLPKTATSMNEWDFADENIIEKIKQKEEKKEAELKDIENNPFGFYGFITLDQKFKIKQTESSIIEEKGDILMKEGKKELDKRKIAQGAVCVNMVPTKKILDVILKLSKKTNYFSIPDNVTNFPKISEMKDKLVDKAKYTNDELKQYDNDQIQIAYYWFVNFTKPILCDNIKTFFENNNIVQYEK